MIDTEIEEKENELKIWRYISIQCPICRISQKIEIPECIINQSKQLTTISIPKYRICEHKFLTVVDKNFIVRGYHKIDFEIEQEESYDRFKDLKANLKAQNIDTFMIKINFTPEILSYAIYGCIFKINVIIALSNDIIHLDQILLDFFHFLFYNSFNIHFEVIPIEKLKDVKRIEKESIILRRNKKLKNFNESVSIDLFNFQNNLIKDFYREGDSLKCIMQLRDKIREIYSLSQKIVEFYDRQKIKPLNQKVLTNYLENTHFIKINKVYLNYLIKVVKSYFHVDILLVQDLIIKQIENLWSRNKKLKK